eukprot:TRINITY_DN2541_c0_g1_i1.p1 TRINITY_DN2541_c0_g1~~TRINITY_DN2541_c0_g1_i1.p1  ORF type:complete len:183 (+),score=18.16 TRINITY_DN2541_c0_g1_i1:61-609(+)
MADTYIQILLAGHPSTGKTSIAFHYAYNKYNADFHPVTPDTYTRTFTIDTTTYHVELLDYFSSDFGYTTLIEQCHLALLVFDVQDMSSLDRIEEVAQSVLDTKMIPLMLVGNKSDLGVDDDVVERARFVGELIDCPVRIMSAKTGENVMETVREALDVIIPTLATPFRYSCTVLGCMGIVCL